MTDIIIKYALDLRTDDIVFIDNAERKFHKCSKCQQRLTPVKGEARKKEWHFRHQIDSDCTGGQETLIHKLAKQFICENFQILIPYETLIYSQARQEKRFESIIPDVTVFANGHNVYFEVAVTNPVDTLKESFYKSGQHKSVEIDLTGIPYDIRPKDLKEMVLYQADNKRKIFWEPISETIYQVKQDKESLWKHPVVILGYIVVGLFLLYKGYKWVTKKNRS
jgi:hypothetical protein